MNEVMTPNNYSWLRGFSREAELSDRFKSKDDHVFLLAAGLMGEVGSVLAEVKKAQREEGAYPAYQHRLEEEIGDLLWYYVRLVDVMDPGLLNELTDATRRGNKTANGMAAALELGSSVGAATDAVRKDKEHRPRGEFAKVWDCLLAFAESQKIPLEEAATANMAKNASRWPKERVYHPPFDECFPAEEQIPRVFEIDFVGRAREKRTEIMLRHNGIGVGDRLTDNIADPDGYRYHDVFHIANAVFLAWSPVLRALLHCKRKSDPAIDENEDGARAAVIEEAAAAMIFNRAKRMHFFRDLQEVDYDLLKHVRDLVAGFEVQSVALWQWERAILEGFRVFRCLCSAAGGRVSWDLKQRTLNWAPFH